MGLLAFESRDVRGLEVTGVETNDFLFLTEAELELVTEALRNEIDSTRYVLSQMIASR